MRTLSVVIITRNEARNLGRCLESVQRVADEIVVLDSFSTDETAAIAGRFGARVSQQSFAGYAQQKRDADSLATGEWILSIDADEALSPQLEASVLAFKSNTEPPVNKAYKLSRLTNYCGSWIKHCGWYPDRKVRLYKKGSGDWHGENLHESWLLAGENPQYGILAGDLLHYSYYTLSEHVLQFDKFTEIAARAAVAAGKDCSVLKVWIAPKWRFFQMFILKRGFLDGYAGYLVCKFSAVAAQLKYAKIKQYRRQKDAAQ